MKIVTDHSSASSHVVHELEEKVRVLELELTTLKKQVASRHLKTTGESTKSSARRRKLVASTDAERTAQVIELWPDYLQGLRQERLMQCEAFLKEGSPVEVSSDTIVVAFPRDRGFHKASIEQDNHRESAERVLAKLIGANLQLKCVFQDEVEGFVEQSAPPRRAPKKEPKEPEEKEPPVQTTADDEQQADSQKFIEVSLETFGGKIFTKPKGK